MSGKILGWVNPKPGHPEDHFMRASPTGDWAGPKGWIPVVAQDSPDLWRGAVTDACVANCIGWDESDPEASLAALVRIEVEMALDPAISARARELQESNCSLSMVRRLATQMGWRPPVNEDPLTRDEAIELLKDEARKKRSTYAYIGLSVDDPAWMPHEWVICAVMEASKRRSQPQ